MVEHRTASFPEVCAQDIHVRGVYPDPSAILRHHLQAVLMAVHNFLEDAVHPHLGIRNCCQWAARMYFMSYHSHHQAADSLREGLQMHLAPDQPDCQDSSGAADQLYCA